MKILKSEISERKKVVSPSIFYFHVQCDLGWMQIHCILSYLKLYMDFLIFSCCRILSVKNKLCLMMHDLWRRIVKNVLLLSGLSQCFMIIYILELQLLKLIYLVANFILFSFLQGNYWKKNYRVSNNRKGHLFYVLLEYPGFVFKIEAAM